MGILEKLLGLPSNRQEEADKRWERENCTCRHDRDGVDRTGCLVHGEFR